MAPITRSDTHITNTREVLFATDLPQRDTELMTHLSKTAFALRFHEASLPIRSHIFDALSRWNNLAHITLGLNTNCHAANQYFGTHRIFPLQVAINNIRERLEWFVAETARRAPWVTRNVAGESSDSNGDLSVLVRQLSKHRYLPEDLRKDAQQLLHSYSATHSAASIGKQELSSRSRRRARSHAKRDGFSYANLLYHALHQLSALQAAGHIEKFIGVIEMAGKHDSVIATSSGDAEPMHLHVLVSLGTPKGHLDRRYLRRLDEVCHRYFRHLLSDSKSMRIQPSIPTEGNISRLLEYYDVSAPIPESSRLAETQDLRLIQHGMPPVSKPGEPLLTPLSSVPVAEFYRLGMPVFFSKNAGISGVPVFRVAVPYSLRLAPPEQESGQDRESA